MQKTMQSKIMEVLEKNKRVFASRELLRKVKGRNKTEFYDALHALQAAGKIVVDKKHRVTPVSYTHLDVYKRQVCIRIYGCGYPKGRHALSAPF